MKTMGTGVFLRIKETFSPEDSPDLSNWRSWLVSAMFYCGIVLIPLSLIFTAPIYFIEKQYGLIVFDIAVCFIFILRIFVRSGSYKFWGACWIATLYAMTLLFHIRLGPHYARSAWLVMDTVIAALFFGSNGALVTSVLNPLILMGLYFFIGEGSVVWAGVREEPFLKYLSFVINTSFIAMVSGLLVGILLDRLDASYQKLKCVIDQLNESESRFRLIAENIADVIWKMDMDLNFLYISPSIYQMQGWTVEEGMSYKLDTFFTPESLEKITDRYELSMKQIESGSEEAWEPFIFEAQQYTKDGSLIWVNIHARLLPETPAEPMHIIGITRDITEFKKTRELIVQSEKMMSVGGLAAGMAHEINNPLAGMIQNADVLSRRLLDTTLPANKKTAQELSIDMTALKQYFERRDIPKMLGVIKDTGIRISDIIENMLSFSRKSGAGKSSHAMTDILDKTLKLAGTDFSLKKHYDFKSIEIKREYEAALPLILCDEAKLQQVFLNILNNGAQAMHEAGIRNPRFSLKAWLKQEAGMVCVGIEDNGPGIDEEIQKRIFEPFFTTKKAGEGTGLGLSVSYFIITEDHNGNIEVESQMGKGTRFTIKLPIHP